MILIYGTPTCGFCLRAKKLAARHGLQHEYKDITYSSNRDEMIKRLGKEIVETLKNMKLNQVSY